MKNKPEQKFISRQLIPWLRYNLDLNMAVEAKHVSIKEKSYNYKSDKSLQKEIQNLKIAGRKLIYKIPDGSYGGTPFDIFVLHNADGYFAFKFEACKNKFFMITVDKLSREIESGSKSLNLERAEDIADIVILA